MCYRVVAVLAMVGALASVWDCTCWPLAIAAIPWRKVATGHPDRARTAGESMLMSSSIMR
jgi:hypothetical protein